MKIHMVYYYTSITLGSSVKNNAPQLEGVYSSKSKAEAAMTRMLEGSAMPGAEIKRYNSEILSRLLWTVRLQPTAVLNMYIESHEVE